MADYGYFDYAVDARENMLAWAAGAPIPFVAETVSTTLTVPSLGSLAEVKAAGNAKEKYTAAYKYAFARDFAHRHRTGSSFLLKAGFAGTALPAAVRVLAEKKKLGA